MKLEITEQPPTHAHTQPMGILQISTVTYRLAEENGELRRKLDRILNLTMHNDIYWAIDEIGRLCDSGEDVKVEARRK